MPCPAQPRPRAQARCHKRHRGRWQLPFGTGAKPPRHARPCSGAAPRIHWGRPTRDTPSPPKPRKRLCCKPQQGLHRGSTAHRSLPWPQCALGAAAAMTAKGLHAAMAAQRRRVRSDRHVSTSETPPIAIPALEPLNPCPLLHRHAPRHEAALLLPAPPKLQPPLSRLRHCPSGPEGPPGPLGKLIVTVRAAAGLLLLLPGPPGRTDAAPLSRFPHRRFPPPQPLASRTPSARRRLHASCCACVRS